MRRLVFALAALHSIPGWGATASVAASTPPLTLPLVIENFERLDKDLKSLSAEYKQFVRWDDSGAAQTVAGTVEFRKPDLLRLRHQLPEPQTVVADGTWLWIYRESTNQVIKTRFEEWKRSEPLAQGLLDFGNYAGLLRSYDVSLSSAQPLEADGHRQLSLALRPRQKRGAQDFTLILRLSTRDYFPADTELRAGTVVVRSLFTNIKYNPPLPDARFHFSPPPGADVFNNVKTGKNK